jgi:hypothetical protein
MSKPPSPKEIASRFHDHYGSVHLENAIPKGIHDEHQGFISPEGLIHVERYGEHEIIAQHVMTGKRPASRFEAIGRHEHDLKNKHGYIRFVGTPYGANIESHSTPTEKQHAVIAELAGHANRRAKDFTWDHRGKNGELDTGRGHESYLRATGGPERHLGF